MHVGEVGLAGASDEEVTNNARADGCVGVTENVADFAGMDELVVVSS
jgi:predicted nuclease of predicted toxin-antitoxin system